MLSLCEKKKKKIVLEVRNGKSQTEWEAPGIPELVGWELWPFSRHVQVYSQTIEKGSPFQKKKSLYLVNLEILACLIEHVACLDLMNLYS